MKLTKKQLKKKAQDTMKLIEGVVDGTIDIPNNAIIIDPDVLIQIFTKKRIELIKYINKYKPKSVQELANLTHRKKQAVDRDLKMLEGLGLLTMNKNGRKATPSTEEKFIIMGLKEIYPSGTQKAITAL
ncbi:MAG: ArsR family transcriptional regulator [Nanoarchaeota archaeon]|nr:ArsR family transcriptional regulator [Nanoarchaeota archaeon]MBU1321150.1 ArsR family transcriptional regulator [Nanoarchaeota archaeon]MBU1597904.1 ArsR family transcriptional regulator [Nanoarchaeota archaeon]MBU2441619.1 ArsR family transcriptional regulator [Nanoarchaeota archaeon]